MIFTQELSSSNLNSHIIIEVKPSKLNCVSLKKSDMRHVNILKQIVNMNT